jgi:hypothetical protein
MARTGSERDPFKKIYTKKLLRMQIFDDAKTGESPIQA